MTHVNLLIKTFSKHFFLLTSMFHANAVSIKIYMKLKQNSTTNDMLLNRKDWVKSALKVYAYINSAALIIIVCALSIHFCATDSQGTTGLVYELDVNDKINCCFLSRQKFVLIFFAFPVAFILSINLTLFLIVFCKTKVS